jgi:hypothetical protein
MNLHTISFKSTNNNDELQLTGYASVFNNIDYHNDIIIKGAFTKSIVKHYQDFRVKLLWQHDHTKPIGVINKLVEDQNGLMVEASINGSIAQGREVISLIKQKAIDSFSIGFNIERSQINKSGQREITEVNLWEVSVVTFPANSAAKIRQINGGYPQKSNNLSNFLLTTSKTIFNL